MNFSPKTGRKLKHGGFKAQSLKSPGAKTGRKLKHGGFKAQSQ